MLMSQFLKKKEPESSESNTSNPETLIPVLQSSLHSAQKAALESQRDFKHLHFQHQRLLEKELEARKQAHYWRTKYEAKATDLTEAKNALFDMQAPDQIPDSQIAEQWSKLCRAIEGWVDDFAKLDAKPGDLQLKRFFKAGRVREAIGARIKDYWDDSKEEATLLGLDRFEYLVRLSIHSLLEKFVFDRSLFMIGLRSEDAELITHIKELLPKLTPRRDDASIVLWQSEALKALCSTNEYAKKKQIAVNEIVLEGKDILTSLIIKDSERAFESFQRDIVEPAITFDLMMRQSTSNYYFVFKPMSKQAPQSSQPLPSNHPEDPLFFSCFELAAVIDTETGKRFTSKSVVEIDDPEPIGQKAITIYPSLHCLRGKSDLLLGRQLILAEMLDLPRLKAKEKMGSGSGGGRVG